jgi:hypothetical protein
MMAVLHSVVISRTRERAEELFWAWHEKHNGGRRTPPQELLKIVRVKNGGPGVWHIYYSVPGKVLRAIHERAAKKAQEAEPCPSE